MINNPYPFGMLTPGRNWSSGSEYRFGFNGKESDSETYGEGNIYDYGFRIYNPRLGKFLSVDPLDRVYVWLSPYAFADNSPIAYTDLDGLERYYSAKGIYAGPIGNSTELRVLSDEGMNEFKNYQNGICDPNYLFDYESYSYHSADQEVQTSISKTIYQDLGKGAIAKNIQADKFSKNPPVMETDRNDKSGTITVYSQKQFAGEYLNDNYYNQLATFNHENQHVANIQSSKSPGIDGFTHFDIGMNMVKNSGVFGQTTQGFQTYTFNRNLHGYLQEQSNYLSQRLFNSDDPLKEYKNSEYQYYYKKYINNVDEFNKNSSGIKIKAHDKLILANQIIEDRK
ncbi:MAG: hypothetical protein KA802_12855 [Saprospiraceae bacterium]|nr:hypothetical protein [Saprospiraceae bacterium]